MNISLLRLDEATPSSELQLAELPFVIGRSDDADVSLEDRWVSRRHCQFSLRSEQLIVTDLGSKHGTFVNGERIDSTELSAGDRIAIGLCSFVVAIGDATEAADDVAENATVRV